MLAKRKSIFLKTLFSKIKYFYTLNYKIWNIHMYKINMAIFIQIISIFRKYWVYDIFNNAQAHYKFIF